MLPCQVASANARGLGLSAAAPGPSPAPWLPWHTTHLVSNSLRASAAGSGGGGAGSAATGVVAVAVGSGAECLLQAVASGARQTRARSECRRFIASPNAQVADCNCGLDANHTNEGNFQARLRRVVLGEPTRMRREEVTAGQHPDHALLSRPRHDGQAPDAARNHHICGLAQ